MYRPLPECVTIMHSKIEGLGIHATKDIPAKTDLGFTHYDSIDNGRVRSPLGGSVNHSDNPNCIILPNRRVPHTNSSLITVRPIKTGEELTVYYTSYQI